MTLHAMTHHASAHMTHRILASHHASAHMAHRILSCHLSSWRLLLLRTGAWRVRLLGTGDVAYQQEGGRDQYQLCFHGLGLQSRVHSGTGFNSGPEEELPRGSSARTSHRSERSSASKTRTGALALCVSCELTQRDSSCTSEGMDSSAALAGLAALAQGTRLKVFRALIRRGPEGMAAGQIARNLKLPHNTLSSHLGIL